MSPDHLNRRRGASPVGTVRAEQVWKRFKAESSRPLLRDHLQGLGKRLRGQSTKDWTWVLRDVDFEVAPGESVALIGLNGSGKSTLLKVLSRVMYPTAGQVETVGRIGALIEVRAGIHPDLTGRENVFFYGTVLGLSRRQVAQRFDDIISFAELEDAVDRQVKFYSSGMQMRLGFAIAAFLEPDVLLVDEVLAVGDMGFQQRCLERMRLVLNQGTTLVFVSHDMSAVEAMCRRAVWLDRSVVRADGPVLEVLQDYRVGLRERAAEYASALNDPVVIAGSGVTGPNGTSIAPGDPIDVAIRLNAETPFDLQLCIGVTEGPAAPIFVINHDAHIPAGESTQVCSIRSAPLPRGRYYVWAGGFDARGNSVMEWQPFAHLDIDGPARVGAPRGIMLLSPVYVHAEWRRDDELGALLTDARQDEPLPWG